MSFDILGPANAQNAVTVRPADGRLFGSFDTWFRDCTGVDLDDGTEVRSDFFNGLLAVMRAMWRMNGSKIADPTVAIVPEIGTDDNGLAKAMQHLVQRGQPSYAADTGAVNALVVTLVPAAVEYKAGMVVRTKVAANNSGAATINVNGLGAKSVVRPDGSAVRAFDLLAGETVTLVYDGQAFQKVGLPGQVLSAPRTYYVDAANGNDNNDGLAAGAGRAFATIQKAIETARLFNLNGYNVTIRVADYLAGSYAPISLGMINGSGTVSIVGNAATPASVHVHASVGPAVTCDSPHYFLQGLKVSSAASDVPNGRPGTGVWSIPGGSVVVQDMEWGTCADHHMGAIGGAIAFTGTNRITGNAIAHIASTAGGFIYATGNPFPTLTVPGAVSFSAGFAFANQAAAAQIIYSAIAGAANVSGPRYLATLNGVVSVNGAGVNYLPGSIAGSTSSGGQYA